MSNPTDSEHSEQHPSDGRRPGEGKSTLVPRRKPVLSRPGPLRLAPTPSGAGHIIEPMLSIDDLAAILSCSRRLVERMRSAGKVPQPDIKIGKMPRWKPETIRRWLEEGGNGR